MKNKKVKQPKSVHTGLVRKNKVRKDEEVVAASSVSNGTSALDSHPRLAVKSRALNDKHTRLNKVTVTFDFASSVC